MTRYIVRRFLWMIPVVLMVTVVTFGAMKMVPGGPFSSGGRPMSPEIRANFEARYHLDEPVWKQYIRYMVGGHAPAHVDEILYRFEFPERPGALLSFLNHMGRHWNISLFHYRNHGAAYGRVLVGMQVPKAERKGFKEFLDTMGYQYSEEAENPAYSLFLGKS